MNDDSPLMEDVVDEAVRQSDEEKQQQEAVEQYRSSLRDRLRFTVGDLSHKEYQKLPARQKRQYRMKHGAPKCENEIESRKKQLEKRKRRRKIAKRSRQNNRRRSKGKPIRTLGSTP